jgi:hypothetical protein
MHANDDAWLFLVVAELERHPQQWQAIPTVADDMELHTEEEPMMKLQEMYEPKLTERLQKRRKCNSGAIKISLPHVELKLNNTNSHNLHLLLHHPIQLIVTIRILRRKILCRALTCREYPNCCAVKLDK